MSKAAGGSSNAYQAFVQTADMGFGAAAQAITRQQIGVAGWVGLGLTTAGAIVRTGILDQPTSKAARLAQPYIPTQLAGYLAPNESISGERQLEENEIGEEHQLAQAGQEDVALDELSIGKLMYIARENIRKSDLAFAGTVATSTLMLGLASIIPKDDFAKGMLAILSSTPMQTLANLGHHKLDDILNESLELISALDTEGKKSSAKLLIKTLVAYALTPTEFPELIYGLEKLSDPDLLGGKSQIIARVCQEFLRSILTVSFGNICLGEN